MNKLILIAIAFAIAIFCFWISSFLFIDIKHPLLIGLVALLVALWTNEGLPIGVTSLLPLLLFPSFDVLTLAETSRNYANPIIFLFIGGFLLAIGMQKVNLHQTFAHTLIKFFPKTPTGIIHALMISAAVLSAILSNTTTTLMLVPIGLCLTKDRKLTARFLLAIAYGASIGGIITPIGTPPNLILFGTMEEYKMQAISLVDWVVKTAPIAAVMLLIVPQILLIGIRKEKIKIFESHVKMEKPQWKFAIIFLTMVSLLIFKVPLIDMFPHLSWLDDKIILLSAGLLLFFPGIDILQWKDDAKLLPLDILFLFGAGFSIGHAFQFTLLANKTALLFEVFKNAGELVNIVSVSFIVSFATEVTSNTALTSIALPVLHSFANRYRLDAELLLMIATISASYAFMLPIATPPNAIVMANGKIKIKEMITFGLIIHLLGIVVITGIAYFLW